MDHSVVLVMSHVYIQGVLQMPLAAKNCSIPIYRSANRSFLLGTAYFSRPSLLVLGRVGGGFCCEDHKSNHQEFLQQWLSTHLNTSINQT